MTRNRIAFLCASALGMVAISVVAKRKEFWYVSMIGGIAGLYFFGTAMAQAPAAPAEPKPEPAATAHVAADAPASAHASETKPAATADPAAKRNP